MSHHETMLYMKAFDKAYLRRGENQSEDEWLAAETEWKKQCGQIAVDHYRATRAKLAEQKKAAAGDKKPAPEDWAVTIRPPPDWTFQRFQDACERQMSKSFWANLVYSYEQKGTSEDTLGQGFHIHFVGSVTTPALRYVSQLKQKLATYGITNAMLRVDPLFSTRDEYVNHYLKDYESKDGHKAPTKEWDAKWRAKMKLPLTPSPWGSYQAQ